jgi:hypothetical protein
VFDIQYRGFWLKEWGPKPPSLGDSIRVANAWVAAAPKLIPIFSHRMMPDEPLLAGNPVFSVHQTDIVHYGCDLADYLRREFHLSGGQPWPTRARSIRSWTAFLR